MCRYFDPSGCGYYRTSDMRKLLHALGLRLPHRRCLDLVYAVTDADRRESRVYYSRVAPEGSRLLRGKTGQTGQ